MAAAKQPEEKLIWPEESGRYKVIQVLRPDGEGVPFLRFSKRIEGASTAEYHRHVVERFAEEIGVKTTEINSSDGRFMIPTLPESSRYIIVGMGKCHYLPENDVEFDTVAFYGGSEDYGMGIDEDHLKLLRQYYPKRFFIEIIPNKKLLRYMD